MKKEDYVNYKNSKYKNSIIKIRGSLKDNDPILCEEWDIEKNGDLLPEDVTCHSKLKVWWKCKYGHSWKASVGNRFNGRGCPICYKEARSSFPEQAIYYYLTKYYKNVENGYMLNGEEIDIYLKEYKIGIEYDGSFYHKNREKRETEKYRDLKVEKVYLIRVREDKIKIANNTCDDYILSAYVRNNFDDLNKTIELLINKIIKLTNKNVNYTIDCEKDIHNIQKSYLKNKEKKSILSNNPDFCEEWDTKKNDGITPDLVYSKSNVKYHWMCSKGHSYEESPNNRSNGRGCPFCSNHKLLNGYNDLLTTYPKLASEFDEIKNNIKASEVIAGGHKKYYWICSKGHSYVATISQRINHNSGCPYCSGLKAIKNVNDFETIHPDMAKDWDYSKNFGKKPSDFKYGSGYIAYWKCHKCGTEWKMGINLRHRGNGCPKCAREKLSKLHSRKIIQYSMDGKIINKYDSIQEAELKTGTTHISMVCRGKRKSAGGFVWKYEEDEDK